MSVTAGDTAASLVRGHTFTPRLKPDGQYGPYVSVSAGDRREKQPNPHLCAICRLAEAAHARSSVQP